MIYTNEIIENGYLDGYDIDFIKEFIMKERLDRGNLEGKEGKEDKRIYGTFCQDMYVIRKGDKEINL